LRRRARPWIDASQAADASVACWPGDTPFSSEFVCEVGKGASCTVSRFTTSPHNGTHADAPSHFVDGAPSIDAVDPGKYVGPCRVVGRPGEGPITAAEVGRWRVRRGERILARTRSRVDRTRFPDAFAHLDPAAAAALAARGAALFGIDTPSVDHRDSKTLSAHKALLAGGVAILENLDLAAVKPGRYDLVAPPVRLAGLDAAPVRALLRRR
jgi:arylformamidase